MSLIYRTGQEAFVAYATETITGGMLAPDATTITAPGTLTLAGYTNIAGFTRTNALRRLRAAGMARPVPSPRPGAKNSVITISPTLSGGTLAANFIGKAFRVATPTAFTFKCLPCFQLAIATKTNCGDGAATQELARCCQWNTLSINIQRDAFVNYSGEIWPLFIDPAGTATMPAVTQSDFETAGGNPWVFEDMTFTIGDTPVDFTAYIQSITINVNNMLVRMGSRAITQGAPLGFNPGQIATTGEEITIQLGLFDRIPSASMDTYGSDMGALSITLSDGIQYMTFDTTANFVESTGQNAGEATSPMSWTASILSSDLAMSFGDVTP